VPQIAARAFLQQDQSTATYKVWKYATTQGVVRDKLRDSEGEESGGD